MKEQKASGVEAVGREGGGGERKEGGRGSKKEIIGSGDKSRKEGVITGTAAETKEEAAAEREEVRIKDEQLRSTEPMAQTKEQSRNTAGPYWICSALNSTQSHQEGGEGGRRKREPRSRSFLLLHTVKRFYLLFKSQTRLTLYLVHISINIKTCFISIYIVINI